MDSCALARMAALGALNTSSFVVHQYLLLSLSIIEVTKVSLYLCCSPVSPAPGGPPHPSSAPPHPRLLAAPLAVGGRLSLPGLLGQLPPPGWPSLPPALAAGLNPALFKSGT